MTERLPLPDLARFPRTLRPGQVRSVPAGTQIGRIYSTAGRYPVLWDTRRTFGPDAGRFDHHRPPPHDQPDRGVLYGAIRGLQDRPAAAGPSSGPSKASSSRPALLYTCVCEVFQGRAVIEASRDVPWFAVFRTARAVKLLKVSDSDWITRAGGNSALTSGSHQRAQQWAHAIYDVYPQLDGIVYASATLPPGRCVVLTDRAADALPERPSVNLPLSAPVLRAELECYATNLGLPFIP